MVIKIKSDNYLESFKKALATWPYPFVWFIYLFTYLFVIFIFMSQFFDRLIYLSIDF